MINTIYTLSELLPEGEPPVEIRLFRSGINQTTKGEFLFDDQAAAIVMEAYASGPTRELMFDFGHASLKPKCPQDNEAAGWFIPELRNGELWATSIQWVDEVADKIRARKYRFYSPAFTPGDSRRPVRLVNCALTNLPATIGLEPLMASELENSTMMQKICEMLGMDPANSNEEGIMSALDAMVKSHSDMKTKLEGMSTMSAPEPAMDPMKCSEVDDVIMLSGIEDKSNWKGAIVTLSNEVKTLRSEKQTAKVSTVVEDAIKARKLTPAQRDSATKLGMSNLELLSDFIANSAIVIPEASHQPESHNVVTLSNDDKDAARRMGVTDEEYSIRLAIFNKKLEG